MSAASEGLWIQSASAERDILSDSRQFDGVIRTEDRNTRILVGFSNDVGSTLVLSRTGAVLNGSMLASGSLTVGGVNVLQEITALQGAVESVRKGGLSNGAVTSNAIADFNVPAVKIFGVLPTSAGGTGAGTGVFVGGRLAFGADDRLAASPSLTFDQSTSTLAAGGLAVGASLSVGAGATVGASLAVGASLSVVTALTVAGTDVMGAISDLRTSVGDLSRGGLAVGAVTSNAIADSNVTAEKIYGVLPVAVGGTGTGAAGTFVGGRLAFGAADGGAERLLTSPGLSFDAAAGEVTLGASGGPRCRLGVDAGGELVLTAVGADGSAGAVLNLRDVRALLQNIGVVPA